MIAKGPFESSIRRVAAGQRHFENLKGELLTFLNSHPYAVVTEESADKICDVHILRQVKSVPDSIEDLIFDVVGNLRAALDNATYSAYALAGGTGAGRTHFPFGENEKNMLSTKDPNKGGSRDIPAGIFDFCASFKPYKGGDNVLWGLNNACNINKHRFITRAGAAAGFGDMNISSNGARNMSYPPVWDTTKNEAVLGEFYKGTSNKLKFQASIAVFFDEVPGLENCEIASTLDALGRKVSRIVHGIKAESARLGLFKP
jgi:hypothetical protein